MGAENGSDSLEKMQKICLATNNNHKLKEFMEIIGESMKVLSLFDIGHDGEIPEDQPTIEGNSLQKAQFIWDKYKVNCLADDTGLLVDSLDGEPGVFSARYAGEQKNSDDNIRLLIKKLEGKSSRNAHFKTVLTYISKGQIFQFEGKVFGTILHEKRGVDGFGYDPVFLPHGKSLTFAEMSSDEKNAMSHRGRALKKLADFIKFQLTTTNSR